MNGVRGPAILVLGASGQVGRALCSLLAARKIPVVRERVDLARPELVRERLTELCWHQSPAAVINAAAYTHVDGAESNPTLARSINAYSPRELALWCKDRDVPLVHFSTDYVYGGSGLAPWTETSPARPVNVYGRCKLEGDLAVAATGGRFLILRTSWLYDGQGRNFLRTILRLAAERESLRVVNDQFGAPTYAPHFAQATLDALGRAVSASAFPSGIFHLCSRGETTWHGFATAAIEAVAKRGVRLKVRQIRAIASSDYPTPAKRPLNCRLDNTKARRELGIIIPEWQAGLSECVQGMYQEALR